MTSHQFHPEALAEYEEAARRYAALEPELGTRFVDAIELAIKRI